MRATFKLALVVGAALPALLGAPATPTPPAGTTVPDSSGYITKFLGAIDVKEQDDLNEIGFYLSSGRVQSVETGTMSNTPRRRHQRTATSISVSPGGSGFLTKAATTVYNDFTVEKDTTEEPALVTVTCNQGSVDVYRNSTLYAHLAQGQSTSFRE